MFILHYETSLCSDIFQKRSASSNKSDHNAFVPEGQTVAQAGRVSFIDEAALVFFFYELALRLFEGGGHGGFILNMLQLKDQAAVPGRVEDDQIGPSVSTLRFRKDSITPAGKEPVQDQVVAVFVVGVVK